MHPLKFLEATQIPAVRDADGSIHNAVCRESLIRFKANIGMACGLTTLPGFTFWTAMEWMAASMRAKNETVGEQASPAQIQAAANTIGPLAEWYMAKAMQVDRSVQVEHLVETTTMFSKFVMDAGPYAHGILENLLKSILVQAWGAFEVLAEDLLTGVIETHSNCFDPQKIAKKFYFRKRSAIRDSYDRAFASDQAIVAATTDSSVDALSVLRNVLVHKSGIADAMFLTEVANIPLLAEFSSLTSGSPLKINGVHVSTIVSPTVVNGYSLVKAVDNWLAKKALPA
ncbi:MAG: hypothetical protein WC661_07225 [Opitutaceae bacterium]|jgi:hypothetical protein